VEAGLNVRLFWCPILYGVADTSEAVQNYFENAARLGVDRIICDRMNYSRILAKPHMRLLAEYRRQIQGSKSVSLSAEALSREIARWSIHYGIDCRI
jgi:DNA repair photolyase